MLKRILLLLAFIFCYEIASAQNGDTLRTADTTLYYLNQTSTGIINRTESSRSFVLNNTLKFNIIRKRISMNTSSSWIYGTQQTGLTNNDFSSAIDVSYLKAVQKLYYWGIVTFDKSYSLKIDNRIQSGFGVGYSFFSKPEFSLVLSDGILYERTDLYDTSAYHTARNSLRLKYHVLLGKIITLDGINFLQQSFADEKDYIIKFNNNLSLKIKDWLSFTISTTYNRLNVTNKENFLCNIGLSFQKTFVSVRR